MLTHRNLLANMLQVREFFKPYLVGQPEVILCPLPLYHIFAFTVCCMALLGFGTLSVLITNPRDLNSLIRTWKKHPITLMIGVNTLFNALLNHKEFRSINFGTLNITVGGGMAVQQSVADRWKEVTGCVLTEGYGMTEASPVVSINPIDDSGQIGTIGIPMPSTDVRIVGEDGSVLPPGEIGELQVKGPQVMKGFFEKPEETEKAVENGWLHTGDLGYMQEDGFFRIVDRKKDMILVSGFNVYPNEIEDLLVAHSKVLEACAVGVPDEKSGEVVKVFVVRKDKSLTGEELLDYCKGNLTAYKVPKIIEFRKDLPKTNVGKILRRALRDEAILGTEPPGDGSVN